MFDKYSNLIEDYNESKKTFQEKMKTVFADVFEELFETCPEIKIVGWTQYTPYFNDGDPCNFRVNDIWISSEEPEHSIYNANDIEEMAWPYKGRPLDYVYDNRMKHTSYEKTIREYETACLDPRYKLVSEVSDEFQKFMGKIPYEIYETVFDDHVSVIVTRSGIDVHEYDHD